jgi:hypothetical protein
MCSDHAQYGVITTTHLEACHQLWRNNHHARITECGDVWVRQLLQLTLHDQLLLPPPWVLEVLLLCVLEVQEHDAEGAARTQAWQDPTPAQLHTSKCSLLHSGRDCVT